MVLIHQVHLTEEDRAKLHNLLKVGEHSARSIARGYILLLASQGKSDEEIAQILEVGRATVQRIRKRYCQKGWIMPSPNCLAQALSLDLMASKKRIWWH